MTRLLALPSFLSLLALAGLAALAGLSGCGSAKKIGGRAGAELSFAQVQTVQTGLTATQVIQAFGAPGRERRRPDGKVEILDYAAVDAKGGKARLVLGFDAREILVDKQFTGTITRP